MARARLGDARDATIAWAARSLILLTVFAVFLGLLGLLTAPAFAQDAVNNPNYRLDAGDQVRVTVFGHEDLSGEFLVGAEGKISLPLVGEVQAKGLSTGELEQAIIARLSPDYLKDPRVAAEVLNYRPFYIIGEVNAPGSYPYVNGMRVVNAVALAGGFTYRADEDDLYITRAGGSGEKEPASQSTPVFPGDVVEVTQRFF